MHCPTCFGHRLFYYHGVYLPCPDCEGQGTLLCCDGVQAQPDAAWRADVWDDEPAVAAR